MVLLKVDENGWEINNPPGVEEINGDQARCAWRLHDRVHASRTLVSIVVKGRVDGQ
ncbi:hypothetical protein D3C81_376370 [compost metagenome]